ncbi:MAG: SCO family protein [Xanthomonadales bacterium]|nr:SCO family protein [Xanthomonadales bacterium]
MKRHHLCRTALFTLLLGACTPVISAAATATEDSHHGHHDHAAMMAAQGDLPATQPALLPDASIYQLDARLTDQHGDEQVFSALAGKVRLVSMFYASCKYVCPLIIDQVKRIEAELDEGQRKRLGISLITLDAANDTPEVLTALAVERKIDSPRWQLMQPRSGDVRPISALLGIQYRALPGGDFNHSSVISLIDETGRILARTEQLGARPDPAFVDAVRTALDADPSTKAD